jgi:hypothetical protein
MTTTETMTTRTVSMSQPTTRALATRSLSAADRLTGEPRREALRKHFEAFASAVLPIRACPLR